MACRREPNPYACGYPPRLRDALYLPKVIFFSCLPLIFVFALCGYGIRRTEPRVWEREKALYETTNNFYKGVANLFAELNPENREELKGIMLQLEHEQKLPEGSVDKMMLGDLSTLLITIPPKPMPPANFLSYCRSGWLTLTIFVLALQGLTALCLLGHEKMVWGWRANCFCYEGLTPFWQQKGLKALKMRALLLLMAGPWLLILDIHYLVGHAKARHFEALQT